MARNCRGRSFKTSFLTRRQPVFQAFDSTGFAPSRSSQNGSLRKKDPVEQCSLNDLYEAWDFAKKYEVSLQVDLIHYSLPYFTEGPDRFLQFRQEDKQGIERVVAELVMLKDRHPQAFTQSHMALRSIPDWLLKGPDMRVPCDAYRMLWVGADGSVKLCYVTFLLGNLHAHRLYELLGTPEHCKAAQDSYRLNCPNCHCHYDSRIQKDSASVTRYSYMVLLTLTLLRGLRGVNK